MEDGVFEGTDVVGEEVGMRLGGIRFDPLFDPHEGFWLITARNTK